MALATSVDENKWVLQRDGSRPEVLTSGVVGATTTITYQITTLEYKYFAITVTAAQTYKASHPELDLDLEIIQNMPNACNIIRRIETRTLVSIVYA